MPANCSQTIISNDYHDYILGYTPSVYNYLSAIPDICISNIDNEWIILHYPAIETPSVSRYGYTEIPKLFTLMDTTSLDSSGITRVQNQPVLNLTGTGTIVGIIDTGIDYLNPIFTYAKGLSKIEAIWDQTIESGPIMNPYEYGTIYTNDMINLALRAYDNGDDPYEIVASKDDDGHGTFLAGIAAGREDSDNNFIGAAPNASLLVVKLKPAKQYLRDFFLVREGAAAYQETDILMALKFLRDTAASLNKPISICIGLGSSSGPHMLGTPLANYINTLSRASGMAIVCCMGNEGNARHHFSGAKMDFMEYESVELSVGENDAGFTLELWAKRPELFSVSITSPTGEVIPRLPARDTKESTVLRFVFEQTVLYIDYKIIEWLSGYQLIFMRFVNPTAGIWRINVYGLNGITGDYNMWLPVTEFLSSDVHFVKPSPDTTITTPAVAPLAISVGAYDHLNGSLYIQSGRGPTADGVLKPDIVAPGVSIYGPEPNGKYVRRSGTSISAALVAGAAALIFSWDIRNGSLSFLSSIDLNSILIRGAYRAPIRSYPNIEWGYGTMDLYNSFESMRIQ